jgi:hypothetical protein
MVTNVPGELLPSSDGGFLGVSVADMKTVLYKGIARIA